MLFYINISQSQCQQKKGLKKSNMFVFLASSFEKQSRPNSQCCNWKLRLLPSKSFLEFHLTIFSIEMAILALWIYKNGAYIVGYFLTFKPYSFACYICYLAAMLFTSTSQKVRVNKKKL